jgi:lysozyme family protein
MLKLRTAAWAFFVLALASLCALAVHSDAARSIANILQSEGGYTNDREDPGGPTNWGITIFDARLYVKKDATAADVKALTRAQAVTIYQDKYWDELDADELPAGLDYTVVDYGVNSGVARAGRVLRQVLGLDRADWHVTPEVLAALKLRAVTAVIRRVNDERSTFLHSLRTCPRFCGGWDKRVASVKAISLNMAGTPAPESALFGSTPFENMFVRFVPLTPQQGSGKGN